MGSSPLVNTIKHLSYTILILVILYTILILSLTVPNVQRNATYAHNVNPTIYQDLSNVEQFGFLPNQVQPFTVKTSDNITIYAWHILPLQVYAAHESTLTSQTSSEGPQPYRTAAQTGGLNLLLTDPSAHLILSFHGNAAHLASGYRPQTYQNLLSLSTPTRPVHVIAFDYRGFGLSTGTPTENGVTLDALTLLSALTGLGTSQLNLPPAPPSTQTIPPSRITLIGQSLGTFVSTATYSTWTLTHSLPPLHSLILLASFPSLPQLLPSYSIAGLIPPLLTPLNTFPSFIREFVYASIIDTWPTSHHLRALACSSDASGNIDVTIMHAEDDREIPWHNGRRNFDDFVWTAARSGHEAPGSWTDGINRIVGRMECAPHASRPHMEICENTQEVETGVGADGQRRAYGGKKRVSWQMIRHGGHNVIPTSEQVRLAVWEALERR